MFNTAADQLKIAIAGSTERTVMCADALFSDQRFTIPWILTASPKLVGRKQVLTANPFDSWGNNHSIQRILIEKKINDETQNHIEAAEKIDILLVVDFGYLIPKWLLQLPAIAPLNIHPSLLPRWRGSSPGQFVLLYGEKNSAVTLMVMDEALDQGPVITQLPFNVDDKWTQQEYYQTSFSLICEQLSDLIFDFAQNKLSASDQPLTSPTSVARRLNREDGFIGWQAIKTALEGSFLHNSIATLSPLLAEAKKAHPDLLSLISHSCRALSPWPGLWTIVPTAKGERRLKILRCHQEATPQPKLILDFVQLEGKEPTTWNEIKHVVV